VGRERTKFDGGVMHTSQFMPTRLFARAQTCYIHLDRRARTLYPCQTLDWFDEPAGNSGSHPSTSESAAALLSTSADRKEREPQICSDPD
jgi:hypothetical protein